MSNYTDLYSIVNKQNIVVASAIQNTMDLYSTDEQKSQYQLAQSANLDTINMAFYYVYFALLIVVAYILIFNSQMNIYLRAIVAALFLAYPFIINYIEIVIYMFYRYLSAIFNGNVYTN